MEEREWIRERENNVKLRERAGKGIEMKEVDKRKERE